MVFNPLSLVGKKYLVTGASSGLGKATSILLSKLGAELILVDIDVQNLANTIEECENNCIALKLNLTEPATFKEEILLKVKELGKLNGFVHLAGRPYLSPLKTINEKVTNEVFMLNTYAGMELAKVFINKNVCTGTDNSIVFISSVYGCVGSAANVGYAMSKSALHGITKSLAIELAPKKIRVNCIAPGFIKTKMLEEVSGSFNDEYNNKIEQLHPLGLGEPEEVANMVAFLFSDMSRWITGAIINVDGGFTAQ